jgi:Icc protein
MQHDKVTRIAHVSDAHMLDSRPSRSRSGYSMGVRYLSLGRPLDATARRKKFMRSMAVAARSGAQHIIVSGDLTEVGAPEEFEALAEALHETGILPERITLLPGNHDAYSSPHAWRAALDGPLRAYAVASAVGAPSVVDRGEVCFVLLDVSRHQPVTRSAGELSDADARGLERIVVDPAFRDRAIVVALHHPPFTHKTAAYQWINGLRGGARVMELLARLQNVYVVHGHLHYLADRVAGLGKARVFGAPAIVDDREGEARVRLYDVRLGEIESAGLKRG